MRVGGFFGVTFGGKTIFQIEDIPKNRFETFLMSGLVVSLVLSHAGPLFK